MAFHIGQRVVCVDAKNPTHRNVGGTIVEGRAYIIRGIDRFERQSGIGVYLEGVFNRARRGGRGDGEELSWKPCRFRPVHERKTDISVFTSMLTPEKEKVQR